MQCIKMISVKKTNILLVGNTELAEYRLIVASLDLKLRN